MQRWYSVFGNAAENQDVPYSAVLELIQYGKPVLGALVVTHLDGENFLPAFTVNSQNNICRHFPDHVVIPHGIVDGINEYDRVNLIQRPFLPLLNLGKEFVRHIGNEAFRSLKSVDIRKEQR